MGIVNHGNVEDVFTYHAPTDAQRVSYGNIRINARMLAEVILSETPQCADQSAAIRLLSECVHTANAAIALKGSI